MNEMLNVAVKVTIKIRVTELGDTGWGLPCYLHTLVRVPGSAQLALRSSTALRAAKWPADSAPKTY